jgi:hypothetical protein
MPTSSAVLIPSGADLNLEILAPPVPPSAALDPPAEARSSSPHRSGQNALDNPSKHTRLGAGSPSPSPCPLSRCGCKRDNNPNAQCRYRGFTLTIRNLANEDLTTPSIPCSVVRLYLPPPDPLPFDPPSPPDCIDMMPDKQSLTCPRMARARAGTGDEDEVQTNKAAVEFLPPSLIRNGAPCGSGRSVE